MLQYLSQEWFDKGRELGSVLPKSRGVNARLQYYVSDGPDGDIVYWWRLEDGHLAEAGHGEIADPDLTFRLTYADSVAHHQGRLTDPSVIRVSGKLDLLPRLPRVESPEHQVIQEEMRRLTDYRVG